MARVGPKKVFQQNLRISLDDGQRFRDLACRLLADRAEIARDAVLLYLAIADRAPTDLKPKALAAWLEDAAARATLAVTLDFAAIHRVPPRDDRSHNGARRPRS